MGSSARTSRQRPGGLALAGARILAFPDPFARMLTSPDAYANALLLRRIELHGAAYRAPRSRRAVRKPSDFPAKKENRTAAFLAINPEGRVPTLLIDGRPLTEVAAILFYLAKPSPKRVCCPTGSRSAGAGCLVDVVSLRRRCIPHAARARTSARRLRDRRSAPWKSRVGGRTLLDRRHPPVPPVLALQQFAQLSRAEFPNLFAHYDRMMARPAVQRTLEIEKSIGYELPRNRRQKSAPSSRESLSTFRQDRPNKERACGLRMFCRVRSTTTKLRREAFRFHPASERPAAVREAPQAPTRMPRWRRGALQELCRRAPRAS